MSRGPKKTKRNTKEKDENNMEIDEKSVLIKSINMVNRNKLLIDDEPEIKIEIYNQKLSSSILQQNTIKFLEEDNIQNIIKSKDKLPFKKQNWVSKFRTKEKTSRASKNFKNLLVDNLDTQSYNICRCKFNL